MNEYIKLIVVASVCLLVGIPLWTAIFAPDAFSATMFSDPGFWIAVVAGVVMLLFGFGVGKRAGLGE